MTNNKIIVRIGIVTLVLLALLYCNATILKPQHQLIVHLTDVSETDFKHSSLTEIQSLSLISENNISSLRNSETYRAVQINEFRIPTIKQATISAELLWFFSSQVDRQNDITQYWKNVEAILVENRNALSNRKRTVLYEVMASELLLLTQSESDKKTMIITSDFMENNTINFYNPQYYKALIDSPEVLQKQLESFYPIPSLNGVTIILVHAPLSLENEYPSAIRFFSDMLTKKGATVIVTKNLSSIYYQIK
jgi:hypothetical protein